MALRRTSTSPRTFFKTVCLSMTIAAALTGRPAFAQSAPDEVTLKLGQRTFLLCQSCHSTEQDGGNKIGPNLWGVFGSKAGAKPNFKYSDALKNAGVTWSDETMNQWLASPKDFLPGTKMAFRGIDNEANRSALIAYLKQQTGGSKVASLKQETGSAH
ncbi:MAG: cytochrome c family protein [Rhodospirillaceae bacterium]|nr:MAG: cytochrome c family protein [Rhodospirillaceae bacterium]